MFVASCRLRGHTAQPSWKALARIGSVGTTTLAKDMKNESFNLHLKKVRRGKKQTNFYRLTEWVWKRLTEGRKVPHVKNPQGEEQRPQRREPSKLMELYGAELAKAV
jgi:hypothetical protein